MPPARHAVPSAERLWGEFPPGRTAEIEVTVVLAYNDWRATNDVLAGRRQGKDEP